MGKKPTIRDYLLDPKNVVFTDRYNKRHIINSVQNAFNFHPYSDTPNKVEFVTIAEASAENLGETISKTGFIARVETIANALTGANRNTIIMIGIVGAVMGLAIVNIYPAPFGLEHIVPSTNPSVTTVTTTNVLGQTVSAVP